MTPETVRDLLRAGVDALTDKELESASAVTLSLWEGDPTAIVLVRSMMGGWDFATNIDPPCAVRVEICTRS